MKSTVIKFALLASVLIAQALSAAPADSQTTSYSARGVVEKIAPDLSTITIHHQAIPGYMMEMTMDFPVRHTNELAGIVLHDEITFTLVVGQNTEWVENIHRVGNSNGSVTNSAPAMPGMPGMSGMSMPMEISSGSPITEAKPGDLLPNYTFTSEDGIQLHLSDFRGKAVALTFFYSRCPLPDYCPRMNTDFRETRDLLSADPNGPKNWQLLSISFDPEYDTPEVLGNYAAAYRGANTNGWLFAAATTNMLADVALRFTLLVMYQDNSITHNLRTIVLDPQGRVFKQFNGNQWTPQQLADAISQAARMAPKP